jgi:S-adenosylmethionine:tRNA ribosyltransferase-isomerase
MLVSDFDFHLPDRLIAQEPAGRRDSSRLLVVDRTTSSFADSTFDNLSSYLRPGDVLVLNNTRVFPARLIGSKIGSGKSAPGGRVEVFLIHELEPLVWEALVRPGRGLNKGTRVEFAGAQLTAAVIESREGGRRLFRFEAIGDFDKLIDQIGKTPLPPYIKRPEDRRLDQDRYQTIYATERGAIAAPTAGLHFTVPLLESIAAAGIEVIQITLHVGYGTFQPVRAERVEEHRVEPEIYTITEAAADLINRALDQHRRIIAVGTTTTRALESAARAPNPNANTKPEESRSRIQESAAEATGHPDRPQRVRAGTSSTGLFIYPGFQFRVGSGLVTNFHLPRSSLLMLVSAFAGRDLVLRAYRHAVEHEYRFYSYGDAMLII